jgi:hypothetical protein
LNTSLICSADSTSMAAAATGVLAGRPYALAGHLGRRKTNGTKTEETKFLTASLDDVPISARSAAHLIVVQANLAIGPLEALLDRPAGHGRPLDHVRPAVERLSLSLVSHLRACLAT